jgi:hypothetical protein
VLGDLVEHLIQQNMISVVCSYGKLDRPRGMLMLAVRFLIHLLRHVTFEVFSPAHLAIYALLANIC